MPHYASIKNKGGMSAQVIACAYGDGEIPKSKQIYSLDVAGAYTAVKAIWATLLGGGEMRTVGFARYNALHADPDATYLVLRRTPLYQIHHFHMVVEPSPNAPYMILTSQLGVDRHTALTRFLNLYTLYPVKDEWGPALFEAGQDQQLIAPLHRFALDWAFRVETWGWDEVLDRLARDGTLQF
jgi:hypothetical protein